MALDVTAEAGLYSGAGDPISWGVDPVVSMWVNQIVHLVG